MNHWSGDSFRLADPTLITTMCSMYAYVACDLWLGPRQHIHTCCKFVIKDVIYLHLWVFWKVLLHFASGIIILNVEASNRKGQKVSSQSSLYCQVFKVHTSTGNEIIRVTKATEK